MARKIAVDLLRKHQGELGVWRRRKTDESGGYEQVFDTLLNFDFEVTTRVVLGDSKGGGAIYQIMIPGEDDVK